MARARVHRGKSTQGERPEWGPLRDVVGEQVMGDFMWMYEVTLTDGPALQVYKHIDTRRSVHLASDGTVFVFEPPDRYRRFSAAEVFAEVFAPLPRLVGVTGEQIEASKAVVDRLTEIQGERIRTSIDIDDEVMREARRLAGTRTKRETVDLALRELVARHRRLGILELRGRVRWEGDLRTSRGSLT